MNTLLALAKESLGQSHPFVLYKKPREETLHGIFQKDDSLNLVNDLKEVGFVFAPFNSNAPSILLKPDKVMKGNIDFDNSNRASIRKNRDLDHTDRTRYMDLVSSAVDAIKSNEFKKVVLSRKVEVSYTDSPITLLKKLIKTYGNAFCYLWYHPKVGIWLGATPEILVQRSGSNFTTMSLAGTQAHNDALKTPVWSNKELDEQRLVTDYIAENLRPVTTELHISALESVRAGQLWHLRTKLSGQMATNDFGEFTTKLHPTPAVCGLPLESSKKFILENEDYYRSFYTGYLGELNFKKASTRNRNARNTENNAYRTVASSSDLYVNLRCVELKDKKAIIYVGGGITAESDPFREWEETVHKSGTILNIL